LGTLGEEIADGSWSGGVDVEPCDEGGEAAEPEDFFGWAVERAEDGLDARGDEYADP
jgi:hypothetical protein